MSIIISYLVVFLVVFLAIAVLKTVLYYKNIHYRKIKYWFYFNRFAIVNSSSIESAKAKKNQNRYTLLLTLSSLAVFVLFMWNRHL